MQDYTTKPEAYFANPRMDIQPLLPEHASRVLEVGCGTGATLRWLKESGRCQTTVGMELFESAAVLARPHVDEVVVGNAEQLLETAFAPASFDLVLCLDVLEHMVEPWAFVAKVDRLLKPGGVLICSIPNVRHLAVLIPLVFAGRWRYRPTGILDRTHLRFFTRQSALELAATEHLHVTKWLHNIPSSLASRSGALNLLTLGLIKDFLAVQYLIASRKRAAPTPD